jgi:hypothetical protein
MIHRLRLLAVIMCVIVPEIATVLAVRAAPNASSGFHVLGAGGTTCAEMTRNLQADRGSWSAVYSNYVLGFISGANFVSYLADHRNPNVGNDVEPDALFAFIERYCEQHQRDGLHAAVEGVYSQLAAR